MKEDKPITCSDCNYYDKYGVCKNTKSPCYEWHRKGEWFCADAKSRPPEQRSAKA